ncbi:MAG: ATP-dependent 6-phosphofructokinase [Dehalococcoidia bacterium]
MRKIGILASGGDAPGMNACIRAATRAAIDRGAEVYGFWDGYNGLVDRRPEQLTSRGVAGILQRGGSIIGAGRCPAFRETATQKEAVAYLRSEGVEGLVVIGGEGSLAGALALHGLGFPTVTVPGTIDNDMPGTDITIGADTAINTAMEAIDRLRDTASAHNRAMIVEVMGRHCGYIAIMAGLATGAEMVITPERPVELSTIFQEMEGVWDRGKRHFIIVLAEGAQWSAADLAALINHAPNKYNARYTVLGYIQRGGSPSRFDRILATRMGVAAVDALIDGKAGTLVAWQNNRCVIADGTGLESRPDPWDEMLHRVQRISAT